MPDIRSFFGPKGGAPPPKPPAAIKEDDSAKKSRTKGRKVIDDSDDDDVVIETKKPARSMPRKKATEQAAIKGEETSASKYFSSSKSKPANPPTPKAASKSQLGPGVEVRMSPRTKPAASKQPPPPVKPATNGTKKKAVTTYQKPSHGDDDAFVDDDDEADDIFVADVKSRTKRKNDDYVEEESEEEFFPKPKRVASRAGKPLDLAGSEDDVKPTPKKTSKKAATPAKKRKTPVTDSEEEEDDIKPAKKVAPAKPRAPRAKKEAEPEPDNIQDILNNVPTVQAPDAPPKDPNAKFDWRKGAGGGNAGPPPLAGAVDIPEGEDNCLVGKTFVFTGLLKTLSREDGQALVKRYGGKVTGAPSSKTDFVVLGDDAGPSKLRKIAEHGIKTIDEAGLFYLIKTMPAHGGSGKGAEKAKQKREEEEKKICDEAEKMEHEEKARQLEAAKAAKKAAAARGTAPPPQAAPPSQLWTTKYAPTALNQICGNKANVERIQAWLKNWPRARKYDFQMRGADGMGGYRAIIISGPPGIGKTTAAHLAAKLEGYDVLESNASDTRSKKLVESGVSEVLNNTSLLGFFAGDGKKVDVGKKKMVLVMDEVDGMSAGDRGGVGALAKFCKKTDVPLILICNERRLPKMKPFDHVAFDIKFTRPTVDQIRSRVMTIAHREGMKLPPQVVNALIEGSNKDIRQIINMLSTAKLDSPSIDFDQTKAMTKSWEKHIILKPWDICQKMIGGGLFAASSKATLNDKIELYFNDHEFSYLMIQENYLRSTPAQLSSQGSSGRERNLKYLKLVDQAAESISDGDLVDRMIHGPQQQWSLMPTHAVFSTVRPSSYIAGSFGGQTVFTSWLGNNSKYGKLGRFVREVHSHMRLKSSGDHNEIRQQYLPVLWQQLVKRLEVEGKECVDDVIDLMDSYYLTREDFDSIKELGVGPQAEETVNIETQTKASFTRTYNANSHPVPFMKASNVVAPKVRSKDVPDLEEAIEEEDEGDALEAVEVDEEELDLKTDKYIKQPKAKPAKKAAAKKTAKVVDDDDDDEDDGGKTTKTKDKATVAKPRGRPKKK
ncbi:replication factor RFC1 C terminal domain-containing protein [Podospora didyma]|uniref:Replication factor C subunit 1 n=1 Tax=Podospora didyma TaxID=330526 RepID=A0AAE0NU79_9PEZI|nr:replication factor RFC1 C terminal domain-containing protein [Podospora didyma]